jgi:hypothetical protein
MTYLPICQTWTTQLDSLLDDVEQGGHKITQIMDRDEIHIWVFRLKITDWPNGFASTYRPKGQVSCKHGGQRVVPAAEVQKRLRLMLEERGFRLRTDNNSSLAPLNTSDIDLLSSHQKVRARVKRRQRKRWLDRLHPTRFFDKYPVCWAWSDELDRNMDYITANKLPLLRAKRSGCIKSVNVNDAVMGVDKWPCDYGVKYVSIFGHIPNKSNCYRHRCTHHHVNVMPRYSTRKRLKRLIDEQLKLRPDLLGKTEWFEP